MCDIIYNINMNNANFEMKFFEANESEGFNFPFILLVPKHFNQKVKIIVESANSYMYEKKNGEVQTFDEQIGDAKKYAEEIVNVDEAKRNFSPMEMYNNLGQPVLIPIIERCEKDSSHEYYTQMLGRNVILDKTSKFANLPQQVVNMVERAKRLCKSLDETVEISKKSAVFGFSASGVFASRLAFIMPEHFDVCLSMCSNAVQPVPVKKVGLVDLPYPLGTADYEKLFGKKFNANEYKNIKQLFFVGEKENNEQYDISKKDRLHDKETQKLYRRVYGNATIQEREEKMGRIFAKLGIKNAKCLVANGEHSYAGKGKVVSDFLSCAMKEFKVGNQNKIL